MKILVIGGGPAGMAAAVSAKEHGAGEVLLLERHSYLGGVLPQCIHNGFGTQLYERDYTGGEYAWLWKEKTEKAGVKLLLSTTVLGIEKLERGGSSGETSEGWRARCVSASSGAREITADAVIIATGCRERTLPQMLIPGSRPAGVFTAGAAQLMMNLKNYLPGKSAVILGSGDIGLIMARRMTLEGIRVKLILGQEATGLARNIVQCVEDYAIPMRYGWTLVSTHGYGRLKGVSVAPFDKDGQPDLSRKEYIPCDTLLVAAGLIPELEVCGDYRPGQDAGLFICGNAGFVHDLADHVTCEALETGRQAALYASGGKVKPDVGPDSSDGGFLPELTGKRGNMICTVCPKGCVMEVKSEPFSVKGNQCEKGQAFARQELENPKRVLTAVVKTDSDKAPVLSVRTDKAIDKSRLLPAMKAIKKVKVSGPVVPGQVVAKNIADTGADLIATWYIEE